MRLFTEKLEADLRLAGMGKTAREWAGYCAFAGLAATAVVVAAGHHSYAPFAGAAAAAAVFRYPWYKKMRAAGEIERELPLALRSMATMLSIGLPFEESLERCCEGSELSRRLKAALGEASLGTPLPDALVSMASGVCSSQLQKAVMQLNSIYEKKGGPMPLKKLAEEITGAQKAAMKQYSGKLVVYSLVFIAISALMPALFQAYVIVGSSFMSGMVTPEQAFWIPVAVFPAVDAAVLALIRLRKPFFA